MGGGEGGEGGFHRPAGGVGRMHHPAMAVAAFAGQVQALAAQLAFLVGEDHALLDQPVDAVRAAADGEAHRLFVAQAAAGHQGVPHMGFERVVLVQHGGDAALGP